ncbi:MAG: hypothetical protein KJ645_08015, partial [Planctomycetes bacterium]|nr:hypothetical protein [Planctomycetota bacterium]
MQGNGFYLVTFLAVLFPIVFEEGAARERIDLSGPEWRLWIDDEAPWENDILFLPPVDLGKIADHPPTCGWQELQNTDPMTVSVPGTVEEYLWDELGDYRGVSWWFREFNLPAEIAGRSVVLCFEAVRLRCEVFVDEKLVGYDVVGNTPFEVDITGSAEPGKIHRLALRITDPGGNFIWEDFTAHPWGNINIPASHGFGGVTGRVVLELRNPLFVNDLYVMNKPAITEIDVQTTLHNQTDKTCHGTLRFRIFEWTKEGEAGKPPLNPEPIDQAITVPPGESTVTTAFSFPNAAIWDLERPALHVAFVELMDEDGLLLDA